MGGQAGGHPVNPGNAGQSADPTEDLDQLFDDLNGTYFAGSLPKYRVRMGPSQGGEYGWIDERAHTIWLSDPSRPRETLLHEMCHIGTPGHGRRFRIKLRRLARMGEPWAHAERAYYLREELRLGAWPWMKLWTFACEVRGGFLSGMR